MSPAVCSTCLISNESAIKSISSGALFWHKSAGLQNYLANKSLQSKAHARKQIAGSGFKKRSLWSQTFTTNKWRWRVHRGSFAVYINDCIRKWAWCTCSVPYMVAPRWSLLSSWARETWRRAQRIARCVSPRSVMPHFPQDVFSLRSVILGVRRRACCESWRGLGNARVRTRFRRRRRWAQRSSRRRSLEQRPTPPTLQTRINRVYR